MKISEHNGFLEVVPENIHEIGCLKQSKKMIEEQLSKGAIQAFEDLTFGDLSDFGLDNTQIHSRYKLRKLKGFIAAGDRISLKFSNVD